MAKTAVRKAIGELKEMDLCEKTIVKFVTQALDQKDAAADARVERVVRAVEKELKGNSSMCYRGQTMGELSCFCDRCYERHTNRSVALAAARSAAGGEGEK